MKPQEQSAPRMHYLEKSFDTMASREGRHMSPAWSLATHPPTVTPTPSKLRALSQRQFQNAADLLNQPYCTILRVLKVDSGQKDVNNTLQLEFTLHRRLPVLRHCRFWR
jgi:hypothetical protein